MFDGQKKPGVFRRFSLAPPKGGEVSGHAQQRAQRPAQH